MTFPLKFEQEFLARTMKELEAMEEQVACSRLYPFPNLSFGGFFRALQGHCGTRSSSFYKPSSRWRRFKLKRKPKWSLALQCRTSFES